MKPADSHASAGTGPVQLSSSGLIVEGTGGGLRLLAFLDSVLRGIGQVMLQNNSYTGLLLLLGVCYGSMLSGAAVVLGTVASTATAMLLGVDRSQVRAGLFGFNGALVAIALQVFLVPSALAWGTIVLAAACTTILMAALQRFLAGWKIPALTAPFVLTTLCFVLATARLGRLQLTGLLPTAGLPTAASVEGVVTASTVGEAVVAGLAQVFFQGQTVSGVFFAAGLLISSPIACGAALLGSFVGVLVGWGMGAAEPAIRAGSWGFNGVLTAIALCSGAFALNVAAVAYALLAVVTTTLVFAALSAALAPIGMPALTLPFVFVVWLFLLASPLFQRLRVA